MGLLDRLLEKRIQKAVSQERASNGQINEQVYRAILQYIGSVSPVYVGDNYDEYVEKGYTFNPHVYSIVSHIAQKASTIPWFVYDIKDKKALNLYKSGGSQQTIQKKLLFTKAVEPLKDHELMALFEKPNPLQGWSEYIEQVLGFKFVTGNSLIHAIGPDAGVNKGKVQEMWVLPTQLMDIIANNDRTIKGYRSKLNQNVLIPAEEIIHLKYWTPRYAAGSFLWGLSPISAARRVVSRSNSSYDASTAALQNSGMMGFLSGKADVTGMELTDEQIISVQERIKKYSDPTKRGEIPVSSYDLRWNQMGMSPVDLAIIESDKMDLRTICNIYHVPSELFNDAANKTYSNTQEASRAIWVNAVIPALTQFRDSFNNHIARRYDNKIWIDFDTSVVPELQDDLATQVAGLKEAYWITPAERREIMGWDEDTATPELKMYWIPAGLIPMNGWVEQEEARQQEAEANLAALSGGGQEPTDEEVDEELKRLKIEDYK